MSINSKKMMITAANDLRTRLDCASDKNIIVRILANRRIWPANPYSRRLLLNKGQPGMKIDLRIPRSKAIGYFGVFSKNILCHNEFKATIPPRLEYS